MYIRIYNNNNSDWYYMYILYVIKIKEIIAKSLELVLFLSKWERSHGYNLHKRNKKKGVGRRNK